MIKRWLLYLAALFGCLLFFAAYRGWTAWIVLAVVALLPFFSLGSSLLFMLLPRAKVCCPGSLTQGEEAALEMDITGPLPLPPTKCHYRVTHSLTGESRTLLPNEPLPTDHCGRLVCTTRGLYFYDFLGMFRLRRKLPDQTVMIRPKPIPTEPPRDLERHLALSWQPKYGGGFSEHHELRLYRPGDSLNQIHWKLSAKTGKLIVREAMIPRYGRILLTANLAGTPEEIDRKLGQLLWMGNHLLHLGLRYELQIHTGSGPQMFPITREAELLTALDALLCCTPAAAGSIQSSSPVAAWHYHIGGDADEA